MYDGAAFLVAHVLPSVPFRQWVISFPKTVRLRLALDARLASRVLAIFLRTVFAWQRRKARSVGCRHAGVGAVTFVQRFSSALRLNVHFHCLVPDGVFNTTSGDPDGRRQFLDLPAPTDDEVEAINRKVARRVLILFRRLDDEATPPQDETLAITYAEALQPSLPWLSEEPPMRKGRRCSNLQGFSLHANVRFRGEDRQRLERLCRYGLRPPFALERLERSSTGHIAYRMKRPAPSGATHRIMTPLELLSALASLVPPPRTHLTRYHGVFAPNARDRSAVVPRPLHDARVDSADPFEVAAHHRLPWGDLLKKVFAVDVFVCAHCGARCRVLAAITDPEVVRTILEHVGLPARGPPLTPAALDLQGRFGFDVQPSFDPCVDPGPSYD
jgi:hypothetical protein